MSHSPFEFAESLRIGCVDFVSPDEIKVGLDIDAPESVAMNTGTPRPFPRVNGYVLVPVDDGLLVGQIEWITVERSPFPKRRGMQDFGLIDLPYPLRRMSISPLGSLRKKHGDTETYYFERGADSLPSIGASVLLPTEVQLRSIVESGERRRVKIGTSPLAGNAEVKVDPDRLFGRHLAVLGNTGSGKSCTVAGLIRWSMEQAYSESGQKPNARFIVLDPNGEYSSAFSDENDKFDVRVFRVKPEGAEKFLKIPLWFWNSAEWCSFTQASSKSQRPLIKRALREIKSGRDPYSTGSEIDRKSRLRRYLSSAIFSLRRDLASGSIRDDATKFGFKLKATAEDLRQKQVDFPNAKLNVVLLASDTALSSNFKSFIKAGETVDYYNAFTEAEITKVIDALLSSVATLGGIVIEDGPDEDVPIHFHGTDFVDHLEVLAEQEKLSQYVDVLIGRVRTFLADSRMKSVVGDSEDVTLVGWLTDLLGSDKAPGGLAILDLSLVPSEVVHIVTAVVARLIFESLQRYRKINSVSLPTVLVAEEAHTFIKRYKEDIENADAASVCCQVFERISREGRKFGLGLVLSSQRPAELSATVLSQCNTFLLHRINNDRDQELVHRLLPDNLKGLLRELPSLPSRHAILLGWASELPVLVRINDLPANARPRSSDPDFWDVWTGKNSNGSPVERKYDWQEVVSDWVGGWNSQSKNENDAEDIEDDLEELF